MVDAIEARMLRTEFKIGRRLGRTGLTLPFAAPVRYRPCRNGTGGRR